MSTSKTSTSSARLAASERSGEAGNAAGAPPSAALQLPDSEVTARPHRRRFSAEYKLSIIGEFSAEVRKSEAVALGDPVMPVFDGLGG
jgi:hypothetical protein